MAKQIVAEEKMLIIFDTGFIVACVFVSVMHIDCVCCPLPVKKWACAFIIQSILK